MTFLPEQKGLGDCHLSVFDLAIEHRIPNVKHRTPNIEH
jgi:hypothetical protein